MTTRRFEVYEVRECEHRKMASHYAGGRWKDLCPGGSHTPLSFIPDDLLEEAAKRIRNGEPTSSQDMARAALGVLFPDREEE